MTIKLCLLKSGEDIIADVSEMNVGKEEERNVVGYFLDRPCVVKMRDPNLVSEDGPQKQSGFKVSLFPWIPLSAETRIPIPADWLVTMVEPAYKLKEINKSYRIIGPGSYVLDLGCAPGGWTQMAQKISGNKGKVLGIDISFVEDIPNAKVIQANIEDPDLSDEIFEYFGR